ncbi:N-acetyl-gamma-glutamyl-phosphate reductase, partial [Frankliniella fusca]
FCPSRCADVSDPTGALASLAAGTRPAPPRLTPRSLVRVIRARRRAAPPLRPVPSLLKRAVSFRLEMINSSLPAPRLCTAVPTAVRPRRDAAPPCREYYDVHCADPAGLWTPPHPAACWLT